MRDNWPCTGSCIVAQQHFSATEISGCTEGLWPKASPWLSLHLPNSTEPPSKWSPTNDAVNTLYKAAGVAAVGLFAHWLQNQMDN